MPNAVINGVNLAYEMAGESGPPMVLVHGSWVNRGNWAFVVPGLASKFRVITYDRRGHSQSIAPRGGTLDDDVQDLAALLAHLGFAQAHVVANSLGGLIALRFAAAHPELVSSLNIHEPPVIEMLSLDPADASLYDSFSNAGDPVGAHLEAGRYPEGAEAFVDTIAPGVWAGLPDAAKTMFVQNAPTYLDELNDHEADNLYSQLLGRIEARCLLTEGSVGPPFFSRIVAQLVQRMPGSSHFTFEGAGHAPHASHPKEFVAKATAFALNS